MRPVVIQPPASEPITLSEAKRQVNLAENEDAHDEMLVLAIQGAREQWEADTDSAVMSQTISLALDRYPTEPLKLPKRPVRLIESISHYDADGVLAVADPDDYALDASGQLRFRSGFMWPAVADRWDAVQVVYVAGYENRRLVPAVAKQAMLLLVSYYFDANRGDNDRPNDRRAYEALVMKFMRASYP